MEEKNQTWNLNRSNNRNKYNVLMTDESYFYLCSRGKHIYLSSDTYEKKIKYFKILIYEKSLV